MDQKELFMFCILIYATVFPIKIIIQKHVATIKSLIIECCQYADTPCSVKCNIKSIMNSFVKKNIIMNIFKKVSKNNYICRECFNFEIYCMKNLVNVVVEGFSSV